ncbi:MAG: hypothetical protein FD152_4511, partial [Xanthobacteraceae bacterium]
MNREHAGRMAALFVAFLALLAVATIANGTSQQGAQGFSSIEFSASTCLVESAAGALLVADDTASPAARDLVARKVFASSTTGQGFAFHDGTSEEARWHMSGGVITAATGAGGHQAVACGTLTPTGAVTYDLGSAALPWKSLHLSNASGTGLIFSGTNSAGLALDGSWALKVTSGGTMSSLGYMRAADFTIDVADSTGIKLNSSAGVLLVTTGSGAAYAPVRASVYIGNEQAAAPATPASGQGVAYIDSAGLFCVKDDGGGVHGFGFWQMFGGEPVLGACYYPCGKAVDTYAVLDNVQAKFACPIACRITAISYNTTAGDATSVMRIWVAAVSYDLTLTGASGSSALN